MTRNLMHYVLAGGGLILAAGIDSFAQDVLVPAPPIDAADSVPAEVTPPSKLILPPAPPPEPGPSPEVPQFVPPSVHPPVPQVAPLPVIERSPTPVARYYVPNQRYIRYLPESVIPGRLEDSI